MPHNLGQGRTVKKLNRNRFKWNLNGWLFSLLSLCLTDQEVWSTTSSCPGIWVSTLSWSHKDWDRESQVGTLSISVNGGSWIILGEWRDYSLIHFTFLIQVLESVLDISCLNRQSQVKGVHSCGKGPGVHKGLSEEGLAISSCHFHST